MLKKLENAEKIERNKADTNNKQKKCALFKLSNCFQVVSTCFNCFNVCSPFKLFQIFWKSLHLSRWARQTCVENRLRMSLSAHFEGKWPHEKTVQIRVVLKMCDRKKCSSSNTISRVWGWVWSVMLKKIVNELSVVTVCKFKIVTLS